MHPKHAIVETTTSVTFRMPGRVYKAIVNQARDNKTSLNSVVNQILYTHYFDDRPILRPLLVALPTPVFAQMLSRLSDEDVRELGKLSAEGVAKSAVLAEYGKITTETIVDMLRVTARRGGYGAFSEMLDDKWTITFRHELGYKGSIWFAAAAEVLFQMAGKGPGIEKTEDAVVIQL